MSATQFVCEKEDAEKKKLKNTLFLATLLLNDIFFAKVLQLSVEEWCETSVKIWPLA